MSEPCYSERFDEALALAADAFRPVKRKGSGIPYLAHLLQVATWVLESGGDEEQAIAALLHDYIEDIDGEAAPMLRERFGERVAGLVAGLSDATVRPKPPWRERKERYLAHLRAAGADLKLISCCDKLHNARSIRRDLRVVGEAVWDRFRASKAETLWYYREVIASLGEGWSHERLAQLREEVDRLHADAGVDLEGRLLRWGALFRRLKDDASLWCRGRSPILRALVLLWCVRVLFGHLFQPDYYSIAKPLNLGIHEVGHFALTPLGPLLGVLGGSLFECVAPLVGTAMFIRQRDYFAVAFSFAWLSTALYSVGIYVADARAMQLPLVSVGGGHVIHDWNYLLARFDLLAWDRTLGGLVRAVGILSMLAAIGSGGWLCWEMHRQARRDRGPRGASTPRGRGGE